MDLLIARGAAVNTQDGQWRTPIMLAAVHAHNAETIMRTLIHAGADVRIRGTYGRTVLHYAAGNSSKFLSQLKSVVSFDVRSSKITGKMKRHENPV